MSDIFISYRREDSADVTGQINDRFYKEFGEEKVFTDVDNIPLGVDFRQHIDQEVSHCSVLIAVIGPGWLNAKDDNNKNRLEQTEDIVRLEIELALKRDILVILVLIGGAKMPKEQHLPETLKALAYRNSTPVRSDQSFKGDIHRLIQGIHNLILAPDEHQPDKQQYLGKKPISPPEKPVSANKGFRYLAFIAVIIALLGIFLFSQYASTKEYAAVISHNPGSIIQDNIVGGKAPQIMVIPAGSLLMGSPESEADREGDEGPQHPTMVQPGRTVGIAPVVWFVAAAEAADRSSCVPPTAAGTIPVRRSSTWGFASPGPFNFSLSPLSLWKD